MLCLSVIVWDREILVAWPGVEQTLHLTGTGPFLVASQPCLTSYYSEDATAGR